MRQIMERFRDAYNERDWAAFVEVIAPDVHWADRRLVGWGEGRGRDRLIESLRGQFDIAPDVTLTEAEVVASGESAYVSRQIYRGHSEILGGGDVEFGFAVVTCVADFRIVDIELFEDTSLDEALSRFEDIGAATEPERIYARLCRALNARDWNAIGDCYADDYDSSDHRTLGWEPVRGPGGMVAFYRSWVEAAPDSELRFEWLGGDDEHGVLRAGGHGHAADEMGGGEFEIVLVVVATVRDGRIVHNANFDLDDEAAAFAHLAELQRPAHRPTS
jgi:ketosteroid isomerase-like protein